MKAYLILFFVALTMISCNNESKSTMTDYETGKYCYDQGDYSTAKLFLRKIDNSDTNFFQAKSLLNKIYDFENSIKQDKYIESFDQGIEWFNLISTNQKIDDIDAIISIADQIDYYIGIYNKSEKDTSLIVQKKRKELIKLAKKKMSSKFPDLRKQYGRISNDLMWVKNIKVKTYGNGNSTIEFTGGLFANNQNKQDFQNTINSTFNKLRFKKVIYKWYQYDDEYTYYTINSKKDTEL